MQLVFAHKPGLKGKTESSQQQKKKKKKRGKLTIVQIRRVRPPRCKACLPALNATLLLPVSVWEKNEQSRRGI